MPAKKESKSSTALWRLDLLETKFLKFHPRYNNTKKLLEAKKNQKILKKLPDEKDAPQEIEHLKRTVFESKFHGSYKKLHKEVSKKIKTDKNKWTDKPQLLKLTEEEVSEKLIVSKLIKTLQNCILTLKELKLNPPGYFSQTVRDILLDKLHSKHPLKFFTDFCQNDKVFNSYVSSLWNTKSIKKLLTEIEWTFKLVRGNLTKQENDERRKAQGKALKTENEEDSDEDGLDSDNESGSESDSDSEEESEDEVASKEDQTVDAEEAFDNFAVYDNLVAASDEEDEKPDLDPDTNYNEVTDEDLNEEDDNSSVQSEDNDKDDSFFEDTSSSEEESPEKKYNLPQLATGYYSGGSDDEDNFEVDEDNVVKQATTQRKNRRGQRARQKIWEKKYGSGAKHKEKERIEVETDRKRRQMEFEERERKRQLKAQPAPTGSNTAPLGERGQAQAKEKAPHEEHPSWKAKKLAEEKLKNTKFTGKKIVFD